jgi:alpha-glucosidase
MHFYGLGDHPGPLDRRGYEFIDWNTDYPEHQEDDVKSLYKSFPFVLVLSQGSAFGLYLANTYKSIFNCGVDGRIFFFGAAHGPDDFYFAYGPTPKEAISSFTGLTGRFPLPPRWALGYEQSRWSYGSEKAVKEVVEGFRKADIPLSAINLDIDYMDGYRVFTVDPKNFPDFPAFLASLKEEGIRTVAIIDPGVKVDPSYEVYADLAQNKQIATRDGLPYVNEVWPGAAVYPAFNLPSVRAYWGDRCARLAAQGVDGIWCDMNEPASFKGPLPPDVMFGPARHEEIHNVYGHYMAEATYEGLRKASDKRPFVFTRACFAGTQRYAGVWTGDNHSTWASLAMGLPQLLSLGLSGMPFAGTDIGGFNGDCPAELMSRWIEFGAFSPFMRNHSACGSRYQEPYRYDAATQANYRKWVLFRYEIIPYLYDLFYEHAQNGLPPLRPLFLENPEDSATYGLGDEFMVGERLLAAPVLTAGTRGRLLYLPRGRWHPFFGGEALTGGYHAVEAALEECPLYAKDGAVIPLWPSLTRSAEKEPEELVARVFPGQGRFLHYQDDGETFAYERGAYNLYELMNDNGVLTVRLLHKGCEPYKRIRALSAASETIVKALE